MDRVCAARQVEAAAAADRLDTIGELFELRRAERGEQQDWAVDTWAAVGAEVAAALRISLAMAGSHMRYALAMRERLPQVAGAFRAGEIDHDLFATMVYRTDLITDAAALARLDAELALRVPRWPSMTRGRLAAKVDSMVARVNADAVRRHKDREVFVWQSEPGMAEVQGRMFGADASALDQRLDAMADSVCAQDPRTRDQRRCPWGRWPLAPTGWGATAEHPPARPAGVRRGRWSFTWSPSRPPWKAAAARRRRC